MPYLVVWGVLGNVWAMLWQMDGNFNSLDAFSWALWILITIGGIYYVYSQNGGASGFDFVQKYYVLGWVVYVRCFLAFIPIMVMNMYLRQAMSSIPRICLMFWQT